MYDVTALRTLYYVADLRGSSERPPDAGKREPRRQVSNLEEANLISSESRLIDDVHHPVFDLDGPQPAAVQQVVTDWYRREVGVEPTQFWALPSSRPGHFHLYVEDGGIEWSLYQDLLLYLSGLQILEEGYVRASLERGATFVRKPGLKKEEAA